jgi:hypothetical protein
VQLDLSFANAIAAVIGSVITGLVTVAVLILTHRFEFKKMLLARSREIATASERSAERDRKLDHITVMVNDRMSKALKEIEELRKALSERRDDPPSVSDQ